MSQPPNPGQPYIPPSSAPSAPGTYNPQQYAQPGAQTYDPNARYTPGGAPGGAPMGAAPAGGPRPQGARVASSSDSLLSNLFDVSRAFASKYGSIVMIVGAVGYVLSWIYQSYSAGDVYGGFDFARFVVKFLLEAPSVLVSLFMLRLVIEIASRIGSSKDGQQG